MNGGLEAEILHCGFLSSDDVHANMDEIGRELNVEVQDRWIPIHPRVGVEYTEVLDDVVSQLKTIAKIVGVRPGAATG